MLVTSYLVVGEIQVPVCVAVWYNYETVVFSFVLETWPTKDVYGMPLPQAVKLICVLCAAGRGVTTKLVRKAF